MMRRWLATLATLALAAQAGADEGWYFNLYSDDGNETLHELYWPLPAFLTLPCSLHYPVPAYVDGMEQDLQIYRARPSYRSVFVMHGQCYVVWCVERLSGPSCPRLP